MDKSHLFTSNPASALSVADAEKKCLVWLLVLLQLTWAIPVFAGDNTALPSGGQIVSGSGNISQTGSAMTIEQNTHKMITNWQSFSIGKDAGVTFNQPYASSIALNRVLGQDPSRILGQLNANGHVMLINPSGVLFGAGSQINVGGITASTLDISDHDFLKDNFSFKNAGNARAIENFGHIFANGGVVALVAPVVKNSGTIETPHGSTMLAAGDELSLDFNGDGLITVAISKSELDNLVENSGAIRTDNGMVVLTAGSARDLLSGAVNNDGIVEAKGLSRQGGRIILDGGDITQAGTLVASSDTDKGGKVQISGNTITLAENSRIDATGAIGGGTVHVGGQWQGSGDMPQAQTVTLANSAKIDASATENGDGGEIVLWSNITDSTSHTRVAGTLKAEGGKKAGNGGRIETSGHKLSIKDSAEVSTKATAGDDGQWLLDPEDIIIGTDVSGPAIGAALASNDVTISTTLPSCTGVACNFLTGGTVGNITISEAITYGGANTLTLDADGAISGGANIDFGTHAGQLVFDTASGSGTYTGIISGSGSVTKQGAGTLVLTADQHTFSGDTNINAGVLAFGGNTNNTKKIPDANNIFVNSGGTLRFDVHDTFGPAFTTDSASITVNTGGAIESNNSFTIIKDLTLNGGQVITHGGIGAGHSGTAFLLGGTLSVTDDASIVVGSGSNNGIDLGGEMSSELTIDVDIGKNLTIENTLSGFWKNRNANLVKTGAGTLTLLGDNISSGTTTITAGTLNVGNGGAGGDLSSGAVTNNAALVFNRSDAYTIDNTISGSGTVLAMSGGALTIDAAHTISSTATGDAIVLSASGFTNNRGADALNATNGRWLVYSDNPAADTRGSLAYDFKQYNANYGVTTVAGGAAENGFLYTIAPTLTVTLTDQTKVYDGSATATIDADDLTYTGGTLIDGDRASSVTGNYDSANVSDATQVTLSGINFVDATNADVYGYQLASGVTASGAITPKSVSVTGIYAFDKTYDGALTAAIDTRSASIDGKIVSDNLVIETGAIGGTFADKHVGSGKTVNLTGISLSGTDVGNYVLASTSGNTTADITPKPITASGITADNKIYDGTVAAVINAGSASFGGKVSGDDLSIDTGAIGGTFADKHAGSGKAINLTGVTLTGADAGNYTLNGTDGVTADITPRILNVTYTGVDKVYDGTTHAGITTGDDRLSGDLFTVSGTAHFDDKNVGAGKIVTITGAGLSGTDAGNYVLASTGGSTTADIAPKGIIVNGITADSKVYDGATAANVNAAGAVLDGKVTGDDLVLESGVSGVFADKNAGYKKSVILSDLNLVGGDKDNYTVSGNGAVTADITAKTLTVTYTGVNRVYDGTVNATVATEDNRVAGDNVSVNGTARFDNRNAGSGKIVSVSGAVLSGADSGNYVLASANGTTTAAITPKSITVSGISADNKVYDGTANADINAGTASFGGKIVGDDLTVNPENISGVFADKNVGSGKTILLSGVSLSGVDSGNYTLNGTDGVTADITARTLNVSYTAQDRVYDGTTAVSLSSSDDRLAGDDLAVGLTAGFSDKNAGSDKAVLISEIRLSGNDATNYVLASATGKTTADITSKALFIAGVKAEDKTYDGSADASISDYGRLVGVVQGDTASLATGGVTARFSDPNPGTNKTVVVTGFSLAGKDEGNYQISGPDPVIFADITSSENPPPIPNPDPGNPNNPNGRLGPSDGPQDPFNPTPPIDPGNLNEPDGSGDKPTGGNSPGDSGNDPNDPGNKPGEIDGDNGEPGMTKPEEDEPGNEKTSTSGSFVAGGSDSGSASGSSGSEGSGGQSSDESRSQGGGNSQSDIRPDVYIDFEGDNISDAFSMSKKGETALLVIGAGDKYILKKGDSLWPIAGSSSAYDDSRSWPRIFEANGEQITDPDRIYPSQELRIEPRGALSVDVNIPVFSFVDGHLVTNGIVNMNRYQIRQSGNRWEATLTGVGEMKAPVFIPQEIRFTTAPLALPTGIKGKLRVGIASDNTFIIHADEVLKKVYENSHILLLAIVMAKNQLNIDPEKIASVVLL